MPSIAATVSRVVRQPPSARVQNSASTAWLEAAEDRSAGAYVLVEAQLAAGHQHAPQLPQGGVGVGNAAKHADDDRDVERFILRRQ